MMRYRRAVLGFLGSVFRSSSGSTLLWMIGALVVLGSVAAGVALMSPSASRGKLEQEAGMRAYYNANAGLQFLNSVSDSAENAQINFNKFTSQMGGTDVVTYTMPDNGTFSYQLGNLKTNGVNGTYQITNLIGTVQDANDKSAYSYVIYGGGKGSSNVTSYNPSSSNGDYSTLLDKIFSADTKITLGYDTYTDSAISSSSVVINDRAQVLNNIISNSNVKVGYDTQITGNICAGTMTGFDESSSVYVYDRAVVTGNIYSSGDVTISYDADVKGMVVSYGSVTIWDRAYVLGDIYSAKDLTMSYSTTIDKQARIKGDVSVQSGSTVSGGVEYGGAIVLNNSPDTVKMTKVDKDTITLPSASSICKKTVYPDHQASCDSGSTDVNGNYLKIDALSKNSYHNVSLGYDSTLIIKGGTYCLNSLSVLDRSKVYFDLSGNDITILVNGNVYLGYDTEIYYSKNGEDWVKFTYKASASNWKKFQKEVDADIAENGVYYKKIFFETLGDFTFKDRIDWVGSIYSAGNINFGYDMVLVGAYYAHNDKGTAAINSVDRIYSFYLLPDYAEKRWK